MRLRQFRNRFQSEVDQSAVNDPIAATHMRSVPMLIIATTGPLSFAFGNPREISPFRGGEESSLFHTMRNARLGPLPINGQQTRFRVVVFR